MASIKFKCRKMRGCVIAKFLKKYTVRTYFRHHFSLILCILILQTEIQQLPYLVQAVLFTENMFYLLKYALEGV